MPPRKKVAKQKVSEQAGHMGEDEELERTIEQAEGMAAREDGPQYKEQSGGITSSFMRAGGDPIPELTADELLDPNPEGIGEEGLLPQNAGMREPGPFASAFKCPYRIYKNPVPMPFIWK